MKRAWTYARVSTQRQQKDLPLQLNFLTDYARQNYYLQGSVSEVGSGKKPNELEELNNMIKKLRESDTLLIKDVSRIGRNFFEVNNLLNRIHYKGASVYSVLDNIHSRDNRFIKLAEYSEIELQIFLERQKQQIAFLKSQGAHLGRPPKGFHIVRVNGIPKLEKN